MTDRVGTVHIGNSLTMDPAFLAVFLMSSSELVMREISAVGRVVQWLRGEGGSNTLFRNGEFVTRSVVAFRKRHSLVRGVAYVDPVRA